METMNASNRFFKGDIVSYLVPFLYLQILDFLTTMVGIQVGLSESSPFIRWMMNSNPAAGLAASKVVAVLIAGACIATNRPNLIKWVNGWYAALVVWNLCLILSIRH
jgi:hypothetical protein